MILYYFFIFILNDQLVDSQLIMPTPNKNKPNLCVYLDILRIWLAASVAMMPARLAFESEVALCTRRISLHGSHSVV